MTSQNLQRLELRRVFSCDVIFDVTYSMTPPWRDLRVLAADTWSVGRRFFVSRCLYQGYFPPSFSTAGRKVMPLCDTSGQNCAAVTWWETVFSSQCQVWGESVHVSCCQGLNSKNLWRLGVKKYKNKILANFTIFGLTCAKRTGFLRLELRKNKDDNTTSFEDFDIICSTEGVSPAVTCSTLIGCCVAPLQYCLLYCLCPTHSLATLMVGLH